MRRRKREAGYNLVMLMVAITVLNIMVALALPTWTEMIQRDREEELISRGFQYVEAIRVFQNRFQRLPVRLEELVEVKPRCIRRLWKDPMTDGGTLQPVFQNEGQPLIPQPPGTGDPGGNPGNPDPRNPNPNPKNPKPRNPDPRNPHPDAEKPPGEEGREGPDDPGAFGEKPQVATGPIVGVRSRSNKKSFLVFTGKEHYDEWRFTVDMMAQGHPGAPPPPPPQPGGGGAPAAGLNLSTRWIGRPLPSNLQGGILPNPGDQLPGGPGPGKKGPAGGRAPRGGKL
jgi:type II secretory pathway pseudopilin PulG